MLFALGELSEAARTRVENHAVCCARCAADIDSLRRTVTALEAHSTGPHESDSACLDAALLAMWVDGTLTEHERASALTHLTVCVTCRRALASVAEALESERISAAVVETVQTTVPEERRIPVHERRQGLWTPKKLGTAAVLAAAAVATLMIVRPSETDVSREPVHREGAPGVVAVSELQAPVGTVSAVEQFGWSAVTGADRYRVTVFDEGGTVVWEVEARETEATPPPDITFVRGVEYLWKVDARVRSGRWISSELVPFQIAEP